MKNRLVWILIGVSIVIRFLLSASTYHSDLGAFSSAGKYIAGQGKWLTFYDEIASKDSTGKMIVYRSDVVYNYQPLAYLIPSIFYLPFSGIVEQTGDYFMSRSWVTSQKSTFYPLLSMYKLPMILADIAILWLLSKFFKKQIHKNIAMVLWAFNPLAIYVSSMMGQVDIIIALLILISLYFGKNKKFLLSSIFVALSALIKPIGLILIPIFVIAQFHHSKKIYKSILVGITGISVYVIGILPYINSASYRYYALFAEQINKSTYASISIASGHDIPFFFILLVLSFYMYWSKRIDLKVAMSAALLSSLVFTHFHPQWLIWQMPLLIIISVNSKDYLFYVVAILCWLGVLFAFDETLHIQLFVHSNLAFPQTVLTSSLFKEITQMSRAGLIATLLWLISMRKTGIAIK